MKKIYYLYREVKSMWVERRAIIDQLYFNSAEEARLYSDSHFHGDVTVMVGTLYPESS